ncbi:hypothetical protein L208DRAFT_1285588, partial [Tricholoma matsutake]
FNSEIFHSYLLALLPPVIGALPSELDSVFDDEFDKRVAHFAADTGGSLYVVKAKEDSEDDGPPTFTYHLTTHLTYHTSHVTTLTLIKRGPTLDPLTPLASQLHFLNLFGDNETPYESLHALVSCGVKPWFNAFIRAHASGKDRDTRMGIPMMKKKFAELKLLLLHLQQNVEIPETHLVIHPMIQHAIKQSITQANISHIPPKLLSDSSFLNLLHGHVNMWIKVIQSMMKLTRDIVSGTASQEINFWLSLECALDGIEVQLRSDEVNMVINCLQNMKRFQATVSFIVDTGLKDAMDLVHKYNQLMKDFPLNELLSATDLDKIQESLVLIFGHISWKLKLSPYPIWRALPLVEAISQDFNDQLLHILTSQWLPYTPYKMFDRLLVQMMNIFWMWDDQIREFTNVARDVIRRKQSEKFIPIKVQPAHAKLQERTRYLRDWRKQHEQLAVMMGPTKGLGGVGMEVGGMDMEEEVKEAYEVMKWINVLDVSVEGTEIWVATENAYNEWVSHVENQIIAWLRDRLGTARNANEMFRVFSKFNVLEHQASARQAMWLHFRAQYNSNTNLLPIHQFKTQYQFSEAYHMSQMQDLPPIAGAIIWARQIERQLVTYMKHVKDVLGKGWELYTKGQKLQSESTAFQKKLDTCPVFEAWLHDINQQNMGVDG